MTRQRAKVLEQFRTRRVDAIVILAATEADRPALELVADGSRSSSLSVGSLAQLCR